ncbi:MAG: hypothetical protein GXP61_10700 [Epsilonproteobacteria bacterium]|nr:hypothetical protein [Campylobacterota bacterium]
MKYLASILLITVQLFAVNIYVNSAKENKLPYAILHIMDTGPVNCQTIPLALDKKDYICQFKKIVKTPIKEKKLRLVNIDFLEKKKEFFIKISPKVNSRLIPVNQVLYKDKEVYRESTNKKTKHWIILLYEKSPFGTSTNNDGINFPITYDKYMKPYIGPVDLNGAPIAYAKSKDINYYLDIQKEYKKGDFEGVVQDTNRVLKLYPNSIFKSDIMLYKLKVIGESLEQNIQPISNNYTNVDVARLGKQWIREFSSNENIPQVLLILVKDYIRAGSKSDVNYFLDILVTEHKDSPYTKKAILYYADELFAKNDKQKAIKLYQDVLYSVKNLDIASLAAIKLTTSNINIGKIQEAKNYLLKVLNANKLYLLKDKTSSYKLAQKLAANGLYGVAATISDLLLKNTNKDELDTKEELLKDSGNWYAKADEINKAYDRYKTYKKLYKDGVYIDEVNRAIDRLFFKLKETNTTKLIRYYNILIKKYNNDIKDKAVIAKAKLLLKEKKYQKVLSMKKMIDEAVDQNSSVGKQLINSAATVLFYESLKKKQCKKAVDFVEKYKLDIYKADNEEMLYKCFLVTARYKKAQLLTIRGLENKNFKQKFKWLQKNIQVNSKLKEFDKIINLKKDLFTLSKVVKKPIMASSYRSLIRAYFSQKEYNNALKYLAQLDKKWPNDVKNLDLYYKIVNYANNQRDDLLLINYAKKMIKIQNRYKISTYTPKIELRYLDALKRLTKYKTAKKIALQLSKKKLKNQDKSRVLYELAEISIKLKQVKVAKKYFKKCASVKTKDMWSKLCSDSLKLF